MIHHLDTFPSVAFKEWSLVCEALGSGRQSLLLRKGGIAEGRSGFGFDHQQFLLFPTWFHGQVEKVRSNDVSALSHEAPEEITLEYLAVVEWSGFITERKKLDQLADLHILHDSVIDERFSYDAGDGREGIYAAFVRIYRMDPPMILPMERKFGGCRSWVKLPEIATAPLVSVLSDEDHEKRRAIIDRVLI